MPHLACVTLAVVKVTSQKSSWSRPPTSMQIIIQVFDMLNKASFLTKFYVGVLWPYTFWLQFNWERIEFTCDTRDTTSGELSEEYSLLTVSNVLMMMNVSFGLCMYAVTWKHRSERSFGVLWQWHTASRSFIRWGCCVRVSQRTMMITWHSTEHTHSVCSSVRHTGGSVKNG